MTSNSEMLLTKKTQQKEKIITNLRTHKRVNEILKLPEYIFKNKFEINNKIYEINLSLKIELFIKKKTYRLI
jgi:hypothetical protein